jgi:hypothetical protein
MVAPVVWRDRPDARNAIISAMSSGGVISPNGSVWRHGIVRGDVRGDVGGHPAGCDGVSEDVFLAVSAGDALGQGQQSALCSTIGEVSGVVTTVG